MKRQKKRENLCLSEVGELLNVKMKVAFLNIAFLTCFVKLSYASSYDERTVYTQALLTVKYQEPGQKQETVLNGNGKYAKQSPKTTEKGYLYHAGPEETWCKIMHHVKPVAHPWIALIPRENDTCKYSVKIEEAVRLNASAVIIYNNVNDEPPVILDNVYSMKTVMIDLKTGEEYARLIEELPSHQVFCEILVGTHYVDRRWKVSRTSVLFVLVSFILLMCISLAWLVFYYVQRFRHIYRNDRKEKQLLNAAKKAISKLKTRSYVDINDHEPDDTCPVCLENYRSSDSLRTLPCKHEFHKTCIDPWLLNHRTCPMCKSNILKSLGVDIPDSVSFENDDGIRRNLRVAGLLADPEAPPISAEVTPNPSILGHTQEAENRYSTSSNVSDTDSDRSTIALVSNPTTV